MGQCHLGNPFVTDLRVMLIGSCVKVKLICVPSDKKDDFTLLIEEYYKKGLNFVICML